MSILDKIDTAVLENYIKSDDKLKYINSLTSGTYSKQVLEQVYTLNLHKSKLNEQQQKYLQIFIDDNGSHKYNSEISKYRHCHDTDLTYLLYKLQDNKVPQTEREEILQTIRLYYIGLTNSYNHTKPVEIGNQGKQQQQNEHPTVLTQEKIEDFMERCCGDQYIIRNVKKNYSHLIEFNQVLGIIDIDQLRRYIDIVVLSRMGEKALTLLKRFYDLVDKRAKEESESYGRVYRPPDFPSTFYEKITLEQLERLPQLVPIVEKDNYYYINLFQKKFSDIIKQIIKVPIKNKSEDELRERREQVQEIYNWVEANFKHIAQSQILWICLYDLFNLDHFTNTHNLELFVKILKQAPFGYYDFPYYYRYREKMQDIERQKRKEADYSHQKNQWDSINFFRDDWMNSQELCEKYIRKFSNNLENLKELLEILEPDYVYKIYYEEQLYSGVQFNEFPSVLKGQQQKLIDQKEIQFLYTNKKYFKPGDRIQLQVSIKNIPKYTVSLFEIDIETYYRENLKEFDTSIPLEGVIPSEQFVIEDRETPAIKKVIKTLEFPSIKDIKRGIFIVDIMGNGISSRAIIKKGSLLSIQEQTAAGTRFTILSEDGQICTSQDGTSGLILNKIFHKTDENGQVVIPFGSQQQRYDVILVHGNFAVLTSADIKSEQYEFKCAYLYNEEQFLEGNKAKVLIQPRLYINGIATTVALLNNVSISAVSRNIEGIPNTTKHNNVKFDFTKEYELEIPIKSQTQSINISIRAQVNYLTGKKCDLYSDHNIDINLHNNQEKFTNLYLRKTSDKGYKILFLGKNAEPKVKQQIVVTLKLKYKKDQDQKILQTDENGAVHLGNLQYVDYITAQFSELGNLEKISKTWTIDNQDNQYDFPTQILITEKDHIRLPFLFDKLHYGTCSLIKIQKDHRYPLQDCSRNIQLKNSQLTISQLPVGFYTLSFPLLDLDITVQVIKGKYWEKNPNFIIDDKFNVVESIGNQSNNLAVLKQANFFKSKENPELSDIKLQTILPENINAEGVLGIHRAHIYATSFIPNQLDTNVTQLKSGIIYPATIQSQLQMQQSLYLNSKQLGDEICYVIDRKDQKKYIGNTLEKPQILLKRTLVKDTNFNQESLAGDLDYGTKDVELMQEKQRELDRNKKMANRGGYGYSSEKGCESFLNFLQNSSMVMSNIPINQDGSIILRNFPIKQYSTLFVVVNNLEAVVQQQIDLPESDLQTKDLRLKSQLVKDKYYSIARDGKYLRASESTRIPQDAENIIINNVEQLFDIQKELSVNNSVSEREVNYSQWRFLQEWSSYSIKQKQEKYNEFASHELNVFIYFKDQAFFESVVKNFLQNKIEKTFVDYFLLGNTQQVLEYSQIGTFSKFNVMEQCLLLLVLVKQDKQKAQKLYTSRFESILKSKPVNVDYFNSLFDTIMLSKKQDTPVAELQDSENEGERSFEIIEDERRMRQEEERLMKEEEIYYQKCALSQMQEQQQCVMQKCEIECDEFDDYDEEEEECCNELEQKICYEEMPRKLMAKKQAAPSNMMMAMNDQNVTALENKRKQYKPGFQNVDKTKEYMETTYYGQISSEYSSRVTLNQFWADAAQHIIQTGSLKNFISINFIYASENNTALIAALAFVDLNYSDKANFQMIATRDRQIEIKSESNSMIFVKEVKETKPQLQSNITVTQRYFDPKDRYMVLEDDPGVSVEKKVEEFLEDKIYGIQVITTNCSISNLEFQILYEIPEGAIPVKNLDYTKSFTQHINSFETKTSEFFFYFPSSGRFGVYPSNVSRKGRVLSIAPELPVMDVKKEKTIFKDESFIDILQKGNNDEILNFIATKNIQNKNIFKFEYIYWLLNDKEFFSKYIQILKDRQIYDNTSFSYCLKYYDFEGSWQYIKYNNVLQNKSKILYFQSPELSYNSQQLLEYHPLLSNRVHNFMNQNKQKILNEEFKSQYFRFLQNVAYTIPHLEAYHYIVFAYYLLLQERIEEAIQMHAKIQRNEITGKWVIQYDYLTAYLDIYVGYPNFVQARQISEKYQQYPVLSWRNLFKEVQNQLTEFDGDVVEEQVKESEYSKNQKVAVSEEHFNVALDDTKVVINHANLKEVKVKYFVLDLEILFSRSPFLSQQQSQFTYVKPNMQQIVSLGNQPDITKLMHPIPEQLQNKNLYIQISSGQNLENLNYFSNQLKVHVLERLGQVKVTDQQNRPLSKVYVKSYARQGSQEVFYRDGYTDMRGRYDYALSSNSDISSVSRFAILIVSEEFGSCIKEAGKPSTQGTYTA